MLLEMTLDTKDTIEWNERQFLIKLPTRAFQ